MADNLGELRGQTSKARAMDLWRRIAEVFSLLAGGLGVLDLWSWGAGVADLFNTGSHQIPMAPSTAGLVVLAAVAVLFQSRRSGSRGVERFAYVTALLTAIAGSLALARHWFGWASPFEEWLSQTSLRIGNSPMGQMSPLTGAVFVALAATILLRVPPLACRPWARPACLLLAMGVLLTGGGVIASYLEGSPWLYGGSAIPMAFWTGITCVSLALGVLGPPARQLSPSAIAHRRPAGAPITIAAVLAVVIATTGAFYLRDKQAELRNRAQEVLGSIGDSKVSEIVNWRQERISDARFFAIAPAIARDAEAFLRDPESGRHRTEMIQWLTAFKAGERYAFVGLFDTKGDLALSVHDHALGVPPIAPGIIATALRTNHVVMTDLHEQSEDDDIHIDVFFPLMGPAPQSPNPLAATPQVLTEPATGRRLLGAVLFRIDPHRFLFPLIDTWPNPSPSAETVLVERQDDDVVFLKNSRHGTNLLNTRMDIASHPMLPAAMAAQGQTGIVEGSDYRGVPVLASIHAIPESPWFVICKVNRDEIYRPLRQHAWLILALTTTLAVTSGLVVRLVWKSREIAFARRELASERQRLALAQRVEYLMKGANDIILLTDRKSQILEANDRAIEAYGYSRQELCRMSLGDLRAPDGRADFQEHLAGFAARDHALFETVHRRRDGGAFPVEVSHRLVGVGGERYNLEIVRDITRRKAQQHEIARLTSLYNTLSQINKSVVRIRSRDELFGDVCQIAAEHAGFKAVWIGWLDAETRAVQPVGRAGEQAAYISRIKVYADDRPEGQGPVGTCIREDRPCIINDFAHDPRTLPWREAAAAHGLRSVAAFPIRFEGRARGAFAVYADVPDLFEEKEIDLLEEIAIDISFALQTLCAEENRQRAEEERAITVRLLKVVNEHDSLHDLCRAVTGLLRDEFDFEATGIRLRSGDDFPYFETSGFPAEFVQAENHLCQRDLDGNPVRDQSGIPVLDCMCGNVLCGRFDPSKPFFSARGSFWTNSTTELLATTSDADRMAQTRNRCNRDGYESVALVPLRVGQTAHGLLQFNDRRKGRFTPERIGLFERLADNLAIAIAHRHEQERVRQGQAQLAKIAATVPGTIFSFRIRPDGSMAIPYATSALTEIYGLLPEDVRNDAGPALAKIHPDHIDRINHSIMESARTLKPWREEFIVRGTRDGDIWVEGNAVVHREQDGSVLAHGFLWDITARKRAEIAFQTSQAELSIIYEHAPIIMCLLDEDRRIVRLNRAAAAFAGRPAEEVIGLRGGELMGCLGALDDTRGCGFGPKCAECTLRQTVLDTLNTGRAHLRVEAEPGVVRGHRVENIRVAVSTARITVDGQHRVLLCVQDETAQKQAETALRESERRFRALVENCPAGIFVQTEGRFAYVNAYATRVFGAASPAELIGKPIIDRVHPDFREAVLRRIQAVGTARQPAPLAEEKHLRLDGTEFDVEVSAVPFEYYGKSGSLVFCRDLVERKCLEAQLLQAQKMEAIGQLAGGVAHDLNNILTVIMINLSLLREGAVEHGQSLQTVEELETATNRASDLTRQLLLFSRRSVMQPKRLAPNELVANLLNMLRRLTRENIDLRFEPGADVPAIKADPGMLEQVVTNLVVNAQDAMPNGGQLTISTGARDVDAHHSMPNTNIPPGHFMCLSISDTGCGIDRANLGKIFEPFFTTKEPGKGTGLGLATAYGIVRQHQGWITVESEVSKGSTFRVFLPAIASPKPKSSKVSRPHTSPAPRGRNETILLVEDEDTVRRSVSSFLRRQGYRILEAENAAHALDVWREHRSEIRLLLSDMVMPGKLNGMQLAEQLLKDNRDLRVIISSGYSADLVKVNALAIDEITYVPKPSAPSELAARIRSCLDKS